MDENKKQNILKDKEIKAGKEQKRRRLKGKEQRFAPTFVNLKSNTMKKIT